MDEKSILQILNRQYLSNPKYTINNLYVFSWESDYIAQTHSKYWYEVEVKISRSDFKNDFKKIDKHERLKSGSFCPNYFSYAVPEGLINIEEIPEYAGLIYVNKEYLNIIKPAPKIHTRKLIINLQDKFYYNWKKEVRLRKLNV
jgi:hypothetical protein